MTSGKLLLVTPQLFGARGGIARIARAMTLACARWAQRRDAAFSVYALQDETSLRADTRYLPHGDYRSFAGDRIRFALALTRARATERARVVFTHVNLATLALDAALPYAVVAHGVEVWSPLPWHRRTALRRAAACWPVSNYTAGELERLHRVSSARVRPILNCLDPFWEPLRAHSGDNRYALAVSRLDPADRAKGIDLVIRAFAAARSRLPPSFVLVVIGDGLDRPRLQRLVHEQRLSDRVRFESAVGDQALRQAYAACDLFVLPSTKEGFGLVYLEAMASARPVIAAAAGGAQEVVVHGETGIVVRPNDVQQISEALINLATDDRLRERLGSAGKLRVEHEFSFERYASTIATELDRLFTA
jgi:glycosyltransferase involved in cell wall biosynthesis